jgi:uncharacterized membrane protein
MSKIKNIEKLSAKKIETVNEISLFEKITNFTGSYISIFIHTCIFAVFLLLPVFNILDFEKSLLVLTTLVSLEAIYLALFIQMTVNRNTQSLENVEKDIDEIQEDVEEINEEVEDLGEDIEKIEKDLDEINEEVEEISEEVEETEEEIAAERNDKQAQKDRLEKIEQTLGMLLQEIIKLRK